MILTVIDNPLIKHKLTILRNKSTGTKEFRELVNEISMFVCYEALSDTKLNKVKIETPIKKTDGYLIDENKFAFIPILRAGIGMIDGLIKILPNAKVGHIGLYRNEETLEPIRYYYKVPKGINKRAVFLLDPMLATGGSAVAAISLLKAEGVKDIRFLCILAAPEGIKRINKEHPDVKIYTTSIDECLNEVGYIVPGLGDAGDRIFGTK